MASRKSTSTTSTTGAYMSQYDQEVEQRLQKLEAIAHEKCEAPAAGGADGDRLAALEAKLDDLIARLGKKMTF